MSGITAQHVAERAAEALQHCSTWTGPEPLPQRPHNAMGGEMWQRCLETRARGQELDGHLLPDFIATHRWLCLCEQRLTENRARLAALLWAMEQYRGQLACDESTAVAVALTRFGVRDVSRPLSAVERSRLAESWTFRTPSRGLDLQACEVAA